MTQTTELTTEERIVKLMQDTYDTHPGSVYDCFRAIAPIIAADIDSRADRVETLMVHRREAIAAVHKARDERDALTAQLAEARAQIDALTPKAVDDAATGVPNEEDVLAWDGRTTTERRIYTMILGFTEKAAAREIAAEIDAKDKRIAWLEHDISVCRKLAGDEGLMEIRRRIGMLEFLVRQPGPTTVTVDLPPADAAVYAEAVKTLAFIKAKNGAVSL